MVMVQRMVTIKQQKYESLLAANEMTGVAPRKQMVNGHVRLYVTESPKSDQLLTLHSALL